jgi:uncharacterized ferritin-like protein (DUF455 family)
MSPQECSVKTLFQCGLDVLLTSDAFEKASKTAEYVKKWQEGEIHEIYNENDDLQAVPDVPARPENVKNVAMSKAKQGSRKAFVHSLAHAESYAIDLMWDMVCRFVGKYDLPKEFYNDWVRIAGEEADHFSSWAQRLKELDSFYGELPGHDGLWTSAQDTSSDILARLAVVHLVHEARGLDVFPLAVRRFEKAKDQVSLQIIHKNFNEEKNHVKTGVKWFKYLCHDVFLLNPIEKYQQIVPQYFYGILKPPFNKDARDEAGLEEEWYLPLSHEK